MGNKKYYQCAPVEIVEDLIREAQSPIPFEELVQKVIEIKQGSIGDAAFINQLYLDMIQSAKFVYCGENAWDLKAHQPELWEKDGYHFRKNMPDEDLEDAEDDIEFSEFDLEAYQKQVAAEEAAENKEEDELEDDFIEEDLDAETLEELEEEKEYIDDINLTSTDDDDEDETLDDFDYDEDDYNEIMDDYEDMYDK